MEVPFRAGVPPRLAPSRRGGCHRVGAATGADVDRDSTSPGAPPNAGTALTHPWSNTQSQGQIRKLKLLKRQMSGRVSVELLRRRVLLAA